jgi:hypothetical protein
MKTHWYSFYRSLSGSQNKYGHFGEVVISSSLPRIRPNILFRPPRNLVTIQTALLKYKIFFPPQTVEQGCTSFPQTYKTFQNFWRQICDMLSSILSIQKYQTLLYTVPSSRRKDSGDLWTTAVK